jgi:hypothetical protein
MEVMHVDYSTPIRITLEITSPENITVLDANNEEITDGVPIEEIRQLYQRPGGVRHLGEILYDNIGNPQDESATCYIYVHLNCKWVKAPVPCS